MLRPDNNQLTLISYMLNGLVNLADLAKRFAIGFIAVDMHI